MRFADEAARQSSALATAGSRTNGSPRGALSPVCILPSSPRRNAPVGFMPCGNPACAWNSQLLSPFFRLPLQVAGVFRNRSVLRTPCAH